ARLTREAAGDALLIAEHGHDFRHDLGGGGWNGAMNYSGFLRPVWWWLRDAGFARDPFRADFPAQLFGGGQTVATMRAFRAGIPYVHVSDDAIAYLRETPEETLLCLAARAPHDPIRVPFRPLETLYGGDAQDGVLPDSGPGFHVWRIDG